MTDIGRALPQLTGDEAPCSHLCYCKRALYLAEIERLREALQEYGDHRYECETNHDKKCTCGYADALEQREDTNDQRSRTANATDP